MLKNIWQSVENVKARVAALKECKDLESGKAIHRVSIQRGEEDRTNLHLASSLITMYSRCGSLVDARRVFSRMHLQPDVALWTSIILAHAENGEPALALELFSQMLDRGHQPNPRTLVALLKACSCLAESERSDGVKARALEKGFAIHASCSWELNVFTANALLSLYSKCNSLLDALRTFNKMAYKDDVSWNTIMLGCVQNDEPELALDLFQAMDCVPNARSFVAAMQACTVVAEKGQDVSLEIAFALHSRAAECGLDSDDYVSSAGVMMYSKCGSLVDAKTIYRKIKFPSVVASTCLMIACLENEQPDSALEIFNNIQHEQDHRMKPNQRTHSTALKACSSCTHELKTVKEIHSAICRSEEIESSSQVWNEEKIVLKNGLVDVYARFGKPLEAQLIFDSIQTPNSITWTSLITAYSDAGDVKNVLYQFEKMLSEGSCSPNSVTLRCVLAACSHAGMVERGRRILEEMEKGMYTGVSPAMEHYVCVVDMLGRANEVEAAMRMVRGMGRDTNPVLWTALLDACRKWKNTEVGREAFESLIRFDERNPGAYDLLASLA